MVKTYSYDPRGAISRANEFLKVGKKQNAVQVLHSFLLLMVKRQRPWDKAHEDVIVRYLNICVDLKDAPQAKDGLHQYRSISQQAAPPSLRNAVEHLINRSIKKLKQAQADCEKQLKANQTKKVDKFGTVQSIMAKVSLDADAERLTRVMVKPWVIFLWESYRSSLELLRNNQSLHKVYHQITIAAYAFCQENSCHHEFKRLCDIVRRHYQNIQEVNAKPDSALLVWEKKLKINGVKIDANFVERQLMTRFIQMEHAAKMDLWTEVWRTIQDIHDIIGSARRELKPRIRAEFYQKVSRVFLQAKNPLFHAYSLSKHYALSKNFNRGITEARLQEISSALLLATISIRVVDLNIVYGIENMDQKNRDIAAQLNFDGEVSRDALLQDLLAMGILDDVPDAVRSLYECLEEEFAPLQLVDRFMSAIAQVTSMNDGAFESAINLKEYQRNLEVLAVVRLLEHLSSVYDKFTISNFASLISKTSISFSEVETVIARQCAQMTSGINVQIDHQSGTLNFQSGGPESDRIHAQLGTLAARLQDVVTEIEPAELVQARTTRKAQFFATIRENAKGENEQMQKRQAIINDKKEQKEKVRYINNKRKIRDAEEKRQQKLDAVVQRLEIDRQEQIKRRATLIAAENKRREVLSYAVSILGAEKAKALKDEVGKILSKEQIDEAMLAEEKKQQKAEDKKAKAKARLQRQLDYDTRAVREAQIPLLDDYYSECAKRHLEGEREKLTLEFAAQRKKWENLREKKKEIIHVRDPIKVFHNELMLARQKQMQIERKEQNRIKRAEARRDAAYDARQEAKLLKKQKEEEERVEAQRLIEFEAAEKKKKEEEANMKYVPGSMARKSQSQSVPSSGLANDEDQFTPRTGGYDRVSDDRGPGRFDDHDRDHSRNDRYGNSGNDRFGSGRNDRYGNSGNDRFGSGGSDRFGNRGNDRFSNRGNDRFQSGGNDRFGNRGNDRFQSGSRFNDSSRGSNGSARFSDRYSNQDSGRSGNDHGSRAGGSSGFGSSRFSERSAGAYSASDRFRARMGGVNNSQSS
jgi:translation initiation factor 3 subunit A